MDSGATGSLLPVQALADQPPVAAMRVCHSRNRRIIPHRLNAKKPYYRFGSAAGNWVRLEFDIVGLNLGLGRAYDD